MNYLEMDIKELERQRSTIINTLHFSNEKLRLLFNEQLNLSKKLLDEKGYNDDLRNRLIEIETVIEVVTQEKKDQA